MFDPTMLALMKKMGGGSSWNDLTDKPFYEEPGLVDVLPETVAEGVTDPTFGQVWQITAAPALLIGETYTVVYNGTHYQCVGMPAPEGFTTDEAAVALGNFAVMGGTDTGEPFAMLVMPNLGNIMALDLVGSASVTISIRQGAMVVHPLDPKFLPDGVPYVAEGGMVKILPETTATFDENGQAFLSGSIGLVVGETYKVIWNGVEYECVGQDASAAYGMPCVGIGNGSMLGLSSKDEPFLIGDIPSQWTLGLMTLDGSASAVFSIHHKCSTEIRKLDSRCLPDGVPWMKTEFTEILPLTTLTDLSSISVNSLPVDLGLVAGNNYVVKWNGAVYNCVAQSVSVEGISAVVIGNSVDGTDPFEIVSIAGSPSMFYPRDGSTTATLSVSGEVETLNMLDPRLYPLDLPGAFDVIETGVTLYLGEIASTLMVAAITEQMQKGVVRIAFQYTVPFEGDTVYDKTLTLFASDEETAVGTFVHGHDLILMVCASLHHNGSFIELALVPLFTRTVVKGTDGLGRNVNVPVITSGSGKFFSIGVDDNGTVVASEITT